MKLSSFLALAALLLSKSWGASVAEVVEFTAPPNWKKSFPEQSSPFPTEKYSPTDGRNAALLVTLLPIDLVKVTDEASLRALHQKMSAAAGASVGTPQVVEIKVASGSGFYSTLEDPTLVGKPPKKDDYKFATPIAVWLRPDILIQATLMTDSATGSDFAEGMQIMRSVKAIGHPPAASPELLATLARPPILIRGPDAVLMIPLSTFKPTGAADKDRHYFSFIDDKHINLSGWIDETGHYPGFKSFWAKEKATMEQRSGLKVRDEQMKLIASWSTVLYTIDVGGVVQRNLRACRTTGNTWVDLHLSVMGNTGTEADLEAVIKSLILKRD